MAFQPISQQFAIARQATAEATKRVLVQTAKAKHSDVMRAAPRPGSFTRFVDGRPGAAEETVRADGVISYIYPRLDAVAKYALEVLFDLSPIGPPERGHYRDAHTIFLNGAAVQNLNGYETGADVVISNPVPYARKIEMGVMVMRVSGSARVYQQAVRKVRARYGNVAKILFAYRGIAGGGVASGRAGNRSDLRFPAMLIGEL